MRKTKKRMLALFCSLVLIATYFINPYYHEVLAKLPDITENNSNRIEIWDVTKDANDSRKTNEDSYCFKWRGKVNEEISDKNRRDANIDMYYSNPPYESDPGKRTLVLTENIGTEYVTTYFRTNYLPTKATWSAGGYGRTYDCEFYLIDSTGQEIQFDKRSEYSEQCPTYDISVGTLGPPKIKNGYINVYSTDIGTTDSELKTIVEGIGDDKGELDVNATSGTTITAEAYALDQYGVRYKADITNFQVVNKTTGKKENISSNTYSFKADEYYEAEYYVSTMASIEGEAQKEEISSKLFKVSNEAVDVTFDAGEGKFENGSNEKLVQQRYYHNYNLPSSNPIRPGYDFLGWVNGNGETIDSNSVYNGEASDNNISAQWQKVTYKIKLTGVRADGLDDSSGWINSGGDYTKEFDCDTGGTLNIPEALDDSAGGGHAFEGWYEIKADGSYGDKIESIDLTAQENWRNITLVAKYSDKFLSSVLLLDKGGAPNVPDSPCYVVGAGNSSITVDIDDVKVFFDLWEGHDFYELSYEDQNGINQTLTKSELESAGSAGITISPKFEEKTPEYDDNVYKVYVAKATAQYLPKIYTVTKVNEGSETTQEVTFGESYDLGTPTREDYAFKGWNTKEDGTGKTIPTTGTADDTFDGLTVYAQWELVDVNVTYIYGYDSENSVQGKLPPGNPFTFPEEANIEGTTISWYDESGEEVTTYDNVPKGITSMTLKAKYSFPITLNYGYNRKVDDSFMVTYKEKYNLPDLSGKRVGFHFEGWYDGRYRVEKDDVVEFKAEEKDEHTLLGRWTQEIQMQMVDSITNIIASLGKLEVDENDELIIDMNKVNIYDEKVYEEVKTLLILNHKYPDVDLTDHASRIEEWLDILRAKISEVHHKNNGVEVKDLEWFIKMQAKEKSSDDELWNKMFSRIDRDEILKLYDVELRDIIEDIKYEPSTGKVTLRIPIPENIGDYKDVVLFHYNEVKNEMEYLDVEEKDGFYEVQLSSVGPIGIAANTQTGDIVPTEDKMSSTFTQTSKVVSTGDKIPSALVAGALMAALGISIAVKKKEDENN